MQPAMLTQAIAARREKSRQYKVLILCLREGGSLARILQLACA